LVKLLTDRIQPRHNRANEDEQFFTHSSFLGVNPMSLPTVQFEACQVLVRDDGTYFVWPISDETKAKTRDLLGVTDLEFGFNNTLEKVPPFCCHECGSKITFYDQVRTALSSGGHSTEHLIRWVQQNNFIGSGAPRHITCENNHAQIIVMGWAAGFGWTYD
jgi:hypothetical protein